MSTERIDIPELHRRFQAQGVSDREHYATVCPICGTVQSMASLAKAGAPADRIEGMAGFSCEGRLTKAGPAARAADTSPAAVARRAIRGCDWSLGGLFKLHKLEVVVEDGSAVPFFAVATPEQAQALEAALKAAVPA